MKLPRVRFIAGFVLGSLVFGTAAYSVNVNNTPEGGYLLCYNTKTKVVSFPSKLSCPSGTKGLELGAQGEPGYDGIDGIDGTDGIRGPIGPQGIQGLAGPAGPSGTAKTYARVTSPRDIVANGDYETFASLKKTIIAKISPADAPIGFYRLSAYIDGLWSDSASDGAFFSCYFQDKKDFDSGNSTRLRGGVSTENGSWSGIKLNPRANIFFYSLTDDPVYLVCAAGGTVENIDAYLTATSIDVAQLKNTLG